MGAAVHESWRDLWTGWVDDRSWVKGKGNVSLTVLVYAHAMSCRVWAGLAPT